MNPEHGKLINIDNGGTLTDICVVQGAQVWRTKTVTTPYDLSKCFIEGLRKVSRLIYGQEDLVALLTSTDHIRYSTTQGTNALVERKGPRLGLITGGGLGATALQRDEQERDLFASLVGDRVACCDIGDDDAVFEARVVSTVNALAAAGANRLVVAFGGADRAQAEQHMKRVLLRKFPPHLLGALPVLYSHEVVGDEDDVRRSWTALFNAFLHPTMERFLYAAEHLLRESHSTRPLLIFRNDGQSARVARTIACKTYSSGPRGGVEGARALAEHYGFGRLLTVDVGGTTTDMGLVDNGVARHHAHGRFEGVEVSFPMCELVSAGVGGSSIIRVVDGRVRVGPESVGSAPGPACFGFGGTQATITDAFLVQGLLDPESYFGGELRIDRERAATAVMTHIGSPLGLDEDAAVSAMEDAWVGKVAASLGRFLDPRTETTLAAFGGGGPFVICRIAERIGISRVIIPGLAAVFSAFGIGFSDIGHDYEETLVQADDEGFAVTLAQLRERARRGMFAEGFELGDCQLHTHLEISTLQGEQVVELDQDRLPTNLPAGATLTLVLNAVKPIPHPSLAGRFGETACAPVGTGTRRLLIAGERRPVPLYRVEAQPAGASGQGPAVLEADFFTCRVEPGWQFEFNAGGDILLQRAPA